jgi:hypothetical protein
LTNALAASCAASIRVGRTSSASIDSDTSIASMTVARSSGSFLSTDGRAIAAPRISSESSSAAAETCRRQPRPFGAMARSRLTLVNRIAYVRRRNCRHT